jgi:hypothetical protein
LGGPGIDTVLWEFNVVEEAFLSRDLFPLSDAEELYFLPDNDDNFESEVNDLDLEVSEKLWPELEDPELLDGGLCD